MHEQAIEYLDMEVESCSNMIELCEEGLKANPLSIAYQFNKDHLVARKLAMQSAIKALEEKAKWDDYYESMRGEHE